MMKLQTTSRKHPSCMHGMRKGLVAVCSMIVEPRGCEVHAWLQPAVRSRHSGIVHLQCNAAQNIDRRLVMYMYFITEADTKENGAGRGSEGLCF